MLPQDDWHNPNSPDLFEAILSLENAQEVEAFFRDLCTRKELDEMSQRWAVVLLLSEGIPYREIAEKTGASTATVTRINQWLQHGTGGYRMVLERRNR